MQRYTKKQNRKTIATIYHQHVKPTKFHDFSSVTEKTGHCRWVNLAVNNNSNNNNIYPRSPLALAVFSGARFSGHHNGKVTIVKSIIEFAVWAVHRGKIK